MSSLETVETKLDILIADFQRFKSIIAGITIAIVLPMTAYLYSKVEENTIGVAIHQKHFKYDSNTEPKKE